MSVEADRDEKYPSGNTPTVVIASSPSVTGARGGQGAAVAKAGATKAASTKIAKKKKEAENKSPHSAPPPKKHKKNRTEPNF